MPNDDPTSNASVLTDPVMPPEDTTTSTSTQPLSTTDLGDDFYFDFDIPDQEETQATPPTQTDPAFQVTDEPAQAPTFFEDSPSPTIDPASFDSADADTSNFQSDQATPAKPEPTSNQSSTLDDPFGDLTQDTSDSSYQETAPLTPEPSPSFTETTPAHQEPPSKPALAQPPLPPQAATQPSTPQPASVPHRKSAAPVIFSILTLMVLGTTASGAFLFVQNQGLKGQIKAIQDTQSQRQVPETPTQPTPTPTTTISPTPSTSPTPTPASSTTGAFSKLEAILSKAAQESSTAELLMISSDNILETSSYKYWFRRGPSTKSYFFIQENADGTTQLYTQANVTPDNGIPNLSDYYKSKTLGITDVEANQLAWDKAIKAQSKNTQPTSISVKYIRAIPSTPGATAAINLWQLSYKFPASSNLKEMIIQLNASTKEVVFANFPLTQTTPSPTATPTP